MLLLSAIALLLFWADAASAKEIKGYSWVGPTGLAKIVTRNYVAGKVLAPWGAPTFPNIAQNRTYRKSDANIILEESSKYHNLWIDENEIVWTEGMEGVSISGTLHLGKNAVLLEYNFAGIYIYPGGSLEIPERDGLVQILGGVTTGGVKFSGSFDNDPTPITATIRNTIIAGHSSAMYIDNGVVNIKIDANGLYITDNSPQVLAFSAWRNITPDSDLNEIRFVNGAIWNNQSVTSSTSMSLGLPMDFEAVNVYIDNAIRIWSEKTEKELSAMQNRPKVVFRDCSQSGVFMNSLQGSINQGMKNEFLREFVTVYETRPFISGGIISSESDTRNVVQTYPISVPLDLLDFTGNGKVEFEDVFCLSANFGTATDSTRYGRLYDQNANGFVDWLDWKNVALRSLGLKSDADLSSIVSDQWAINTLQPKVLELAGEIHINYPKVEEAAMSDPQFWSFIESFLPVTAILDESAGVPSEFSLEQNYPNPFNASTNILFALAEDGEVALVIRNLTGQVVRTLVQEYLSAGAYTEKWDGKDNFGVSTSTGIYLCELRAGSERMVRKIMLLR